MRNLGFDELAQTAGAVLAYPDAVGGSWNDGRANVESTAHQRQIDDMGFLEALIADSVGRDGVDPARIALVGHSNGAMMAGRMACARAERFRALVLVSGIAAAELAEQCQPGRAVSVLQVHGLRDPMVPYQGGVIGSIDGKSRGAAASVKTMLEVWRRRCGCTGVSERVLAGTTPAVVEQTATGCAGGTEVIHDRYDDPTHGWPAFTGWDATGAAKRFLARQLA